MTKTIFETGMPPATNRHRDTIGPGADCYGHSSVAASRLKKGANHKQVLRDFKREALQIYLQLLDRQ